MERISLGNEDYEGKNNVYYVTESSPVTLIDAATATQGVYNQLTRSLASSDVSVPDIEQILLTHWHPDHVGLAGLLQEKSDATIFIHEEDAPLIQEQPWIKLEPILRERFSEWAMPTQKRDEVIHQFTNGRRELSRPISEIAVFEDGDSFDLGELQLEALHAPGHTAGMSCFWFDTEGTTQVCSGDALLPVYTPNIGGADVRVKDPLEQYLKTLTRLFEKDFDRAWPGHRDPIDDPNNRVIEILHHHRQRTQRVINILQEHGPLSVWEVSDSLFGELEGIHILHGPGEAYAHLTHLHHRGLIYREEDQYLIESDPIPDIESIFPRLDSGRTDSEQETFSEA